MEVYEGVRVPFFEAALPEQGDEVPLNFLGIDGRSTLFFYGQRKTDVCLVVIRDVRQSWMIGYEMRQRTIHRVASPDSSMTLVPNIEARCLPPSYASLWVYPLILSSPPNHFLNAMAKWSKL